MYVRRSGVKADEQEGLKPVFTELASLPIPVSSSNKTDHEPEYPSAMELDDTHWAISTGSGSIYILRTSPITEPFSGKFTARYDLDTPFLLRTSHSISASESRLILSRPSPSTGGGSKQDKTFDLMEVSINPTMENAVDDSPGKLEVNWSLQSADLPYWCKWNGDGWTVLAAELFRGSSEAGPSTTPTHGSGMPSASRGGIGAEDGTTSIATPEKSLIEEDRVWPFSWTQTADSIAMTVPFPTGTKRSDIVVTLKTGEFSLSTNPSAPVPLSPLSDFLRRQTRSFWSDIDTDSSTFTYNPDKALLELELVKADDHSRWPSVFSPLDDDEEEEEEEVPETLDAATLAAVRASFDNIKTRQPGEEPTGNHPAMPALLSEEMDIDHMDEEDDMPEGPFGDKGGKVGRDVFIGHMKDGIPSWSKTTVTVVSTPISSPTNNDDGLIVKSAIDGLYYRPSSSGDITKTPWTHTSTTPALAFVLSSKRDIRLVRHIASSSASSTTVLAFDAGSTGEQAQGNVYVYYPPDSKMYAKQGVVGVSGREKGALLGVGSVSVDGKDVVLVLCEKELVVLHGVC